MRSNRSAIGATLAVIITLAIVAIVLSAFYLGQITAKATTQISQTSSFGLCCSNVLTVSLTSAMLYGGMSGNGTQTASASFSFLLNNPGSSTTINSITLTGSAINSITRWSTSANTANSVNFTAQYETNGANAMPAGQVSSFAYYPISPNSAQMIGTGRVFDYVINLATGQSVSGSLIAQ